MIINTEIAYEIKKHKVFVEYLEDSKISFDEFMIASLIKSCKKDDDKIIEAIEEVAGTGDLRTLFIQIYRELEEMDLSKAQLDKMIDESTMVKLMQKQFNIIENPITKTFYLKGSQIDIKKISDISKTSKNTAKIFSMGEIQNIRLINPEESTMKENAKINITGKEAHVLSPKINTKLSFGKLKDMISIEPTDVVVNKLDDEYNLEYRIIDGHMANEINDMKNVSGSTFTKVNQDGVRFISVNKWQEYFIYSDIHDLSKEILDGTWKDLSNKKYDSSFTKEMFIIWAEKHFGKEAIAKRLEELISRTATKVVATKLKEYAEIDNIKLNIVSWTVIMSYTKTTRDLSYIYSNCPSIFDDAQILKLGNYDKSLLIAKDKKMYDTYQNDLKTLQGEYNTLVGESQNEGIRDPLKSVVGNNRTKEINKIFNNIAHRKAGVVKQWTLETLQKEFKKLQEAMDYAKDYIQKHK